MTTALIEARECAQHICITGASSGIGRALAVRYAAPNVRLSVIARSAKKLEALKVECEALGAIVDLIVADVCDQENTQLVLSAMVQNHPVDLLIINAGISQTQATSECREAGKAGSTLETEAKLVDVHLHGMLNVLHPVLHSMRKCKRGQIVLMGSLNSLVIIPRSAIYGAVKAAILSYGLALRAKLADDNIKVNVICPGWVKTALTDLNTFAMPGIMHSSTAAACIVKGIAKNKAVIGFPRRLYWACYLFQAMPAAVKVWLSKRIS